MDDLITLMAAACLVMWMAAPPMNNGLPKTPSGHWYQPDFDQTDDVVGRKRSALRIAVDHGTGCQYLVTMLGGITARLDADGKPICVKR